MFGVGEVLFYRNSLFLVRFVFEVMFNGFWMVLGGILGDKWVPKWVEKSIKKLMDFLIAPGRALKLQKETLTGSEWSVLGPRGRVGKG